VALGDSYSSGLGAGNYLDDGTDCKRSLGGFPGVLAAANQLDLNLQACSGAVIKDVREHQLGALSSSTSLVSISVGGNDVGFAKVLTQCAQPGWMSKCDQAIDQANREIDALGAALDSLYAEISRRAPHARIVVAGYPRLFNGRDCHAVTFFSGAEMSRLNKTADRLAGVLKSAAGRAGFTFADVRDSFTGHAVCDNPEWIHNLSMSVSQSFHPKLDGYRHGYAPPVASGLGLTSRAASHAQAASVKTGGQTVSDPKRGRLDWRLITR